MVIKRYQVILIILLLIPNQIALADQECLDKTCVDVFTENNQIIITASKNGATATPMPSKKVVAKPKPALTKKNTPRPVAKIAVPKSNSDKG